MTVQSTLPALLIMAVAGCAPGMESADAPGTQAEGQARQCFSTSQVRNFRADGITTVYLRANDTVYEVNAAGGCRDLDFTSSLAITSDLPSAGGSRLCVGDSARILVPGAMGGACRVRVSRALTAEEVAALPSANRP